MRDRYFKLALIIEELIDQFDKFSVSYNQTFICGALRYCSKVLEKMISFSIVNDSIYKLIELFTDSVQKILYQNNKNSLVDLDLQFLEEHFERVQQLCKRYNILLLLEDLICEVNNG